MSIPKDPRQLMINLMYLVLTALLALNVSAEVLQAFLKMDESLAYSANLAGNTNQRMVAAIYQHADAYPQLTPFKNKVEQVQEITRQYYQTLDGIEKEFLTATGEQKDGVPVDIRNKDIPTNFFINENKGTAIWDAFLGTREKLLALLENEEDRSMMEPRMPALSHDFNNGEDWALETFRQLPVAAALPLLTKYKTDIQTAETALLNFYFEKMNVQDKVDAYEPVVVASKNYLTQGEVYEGSIFLASYNSAAENIRVKVDGKNIPVENGSARFTRQVSGSGQQEHMVEIELENPLTGEIQTFKKPFSYQVGQKSVTVAATKMNVLYLGIPNPIEVSAAGIPSHKIQVSGSNVNLEKTGSNAYLATPVQVGEAVIKVSDGQDENRFTYRVKRIPDPVAELGGKTQGNMSPGEMKVQPGIIPRLKDFHFEAKCNITTFDVARISKAGDASVVSNNGGRFGESADRMVKAATYGDTYYFNNIRAKCPGESVTRELSPMIFQIR
ncbi:MAG: gliding motility protein GldM [Saprospiraceae bacterium]|nr:gliding motility protein GldM [Saprospiraceae bacterium]